MNQDKFKKYRGIKALLLLKPLMYAGGCHDVVILDFARSVTFKLEKKIITQKDSFFLSFDELKHFNLTTSKN